ncbi:MAG: TolC family protein, partial [Verrucomicrobia bacterium]|nr:TolC family protein [Verrucomicrobiota bacterium]
SPEERTPPSDTNEHRVLEIRLGQAVLMALANNRALSVQRLAPDIQRTFEAEERALFDPVLSADLFTEQGNDEDPSISTNSSDVTTIKRTGGSLGITELLPTGTKIGVNVSTERKADGGADDEYATRAEIDASQALLQGRPIAVNLIRLHQARLDTEISEYELRGFAETLVATVEGAYWECVLAHRRAEIVEKSMTLAQQQLKEIEHRIRVGDLPETELAAAQAETALRNEELINARSAIAASRLRLLRLIDPDTLNGPRRELVLRTEPAVPDIPLDSTGSHVDMALKMRPDINEARLRVKRDDLELVQTKNGLLPKLDLFVLLGKTGYSESFGDSASEIGGDNYDLSAGIRFEFPIGNRAAAARHQRARFTREQTAEALNNLADLVRVDVESAFIEVERTKAQVIATATTRHFQEEKVRAETAKFNVGRSTALLVTQAQRDLVVSQVSEVDAVIRHLEALVLLFRLEGTLLERRGLSAPGRIPVKEAQTVAPANTR